MSRDVKITCLVAAGAFSLLASSGSGRPAAIPGGATHTVTIEGMRFNPERLAIEVGETVVWANKDLFPHTATSNAGGFDSQQIASGESWRHTFGKKGKFAYVCTLHPPMKAAIQVN